MDKVKQTSCKIFLPSRITGARKLIGSYTDEIVERIVLLVARKGKITQYQQPPQKNKKMTNSLTSAKDD